MFSVFFFLLAIVLFLSHLNDKRNRPEQPRAPRMTVRQMVALMLLAIGGGLAVHSASMLVVGPLAQPDPASPSPFPVWSPLEIFAGVATSTWWLCAGIGLVVFCVGVVVSDGKHPIPRAVTPERLQDS